MAVIGKISSLQHLFYKTQALHTLYEYLLMATDQTNTIHKRILSLDGEKIETLKDGMFAIEQSYLLKEEKDAIFETHLQYIDFQLVVSGEEFFMLGDKNDLVIQEKDEKRDLIFYQPCSQVSKIYFQAKTLGIFFDYDAHAGGLALESLNTQMRVFKTVVKVPKELIKLKL